MKASNWTTENILSQDGKVILTTSSNSGLGLEVSKVLSNKGALVVMTARDLKK